MTFFSNLSVLYLSNITYSFNSGTDTDHNNTGKTKPNNILQGWFLLENRRFENQWKIAKTIYTTFQSGHFLPVLTVSSNFQRKIAEIS